MSKRAFQSPSSTIFFLQLLFIASRAQNNLNCSPSTCGNIKEIEFPFSLKTDPNSCGAGFSSYKLACNKNQAYISINSTSFLVQSISYRNNSFRIVDPVLATPNKSCIPLSNHFNGYNQIGTSVDEFNRFNNDVAFINCDAPFSSPGFFETPICGKSTNSSQDVYSYVALEEDLKVSELGESCKIDMVASGSAYGPLNGAASLDEIKNGLAYGFELTWYGSFCGGCDAVNGSCSINGNEITCNAHGVHLGDIERITRIVIGFVSVRFVSGIILLVVLVVYKQRQKRRG